VCNPDSCNDTPCRATSLFITPGTRASPQHSPFGSGLPVVPAHLKAVTGKVLR